MSTKRFRVYHFLFSWIFTLLIGLLIGCVADPGISLITAIVAAALSSPFILLFMISMHFVLRKSPTRNRLHLMTFAFHFTGSFLLFFAILYFGANDIGGDGGALLLLMLGYFIVDSIFFHAFIQRLYKDTPRKIDPEILDILD